MNTDIKFSEIKTKVKSTTQLDEERFETGKNRKALIYCLATAGAITLISLLVSFKTPIPDPPPPPPMEDIVEIEIAEEINFGNDVNGGMGKLQPLHKEAPAPPPPSNNNESKSSNEDPPSRTITDDNDDKAPSVVKPPYQTPPTRKPSTTSSNNEPRTNNTNVPSTPRPRTTMGTRPGSTGPGGNNADRNNGLNSQGNGTGIGDAGNPDGSLTGNGKIILKNADLKNNGTIQSLLNSSGTNYNGTIHIEINVNADGNYAGLRSINVSPDSKEGKAAKSFVINNVLSKLKFNAGSGTRKASLDLQFRYNN
jgi:hypothetical protein